MSGTIIDGIGFPHHVQILDAIKKYPKQQKHVLYGTAGFRDNISVPLEPIFVKVGILGCIRSLNQNSRAVGVMITASHNPEQDNGVKIIDHDGGMLTQPWESYAEELANAEDDDFLKVIESILNQSSTKSTCSSTPPVVFVGRDTRPHSERLSKCVELGIHAAGGISIDMGEVTTPQLHYIVGISNQKQLNLTADHMPDITALKEQYYQDFANAYLSLIHTNTTKTICDGTTSKTSNQINNSHRDNLIVDASNGVGSIALEQVLRCIKLVSDNNTSITTTIPLISQDYSNITIRNIARSGKVNDHCGAEHCQKNLVPPIGVDCIKDQDQLLCSFDGDADRIVFHSFLSSSSPSTSVVTTNGNQHDNNENSNNDSDKSSWVLMDGDKIAALFICFLQNELQYITSPPVTPDIINNLVNNNNSCSSSTNKNSNNLKRSRDDDNNNNTSSSLHQSMSDIEVGVVQTAYANGASTQFFLDRQVTVHMARTGVKYLHRKAHDCYDVGVYFEANGHGTILFSEKYLHIINTTMASLSSSNNNSCSDSYSSSSSSSSSAYSARQVLAIQRLHATTHLVNQMIGDAISDMFLSIAALQILYMSIQDWHNLYTDLPSKMIKVPVRDKNLIICSEDETHVISPAELQLALTQVMSVSAASGNRGRCFVRPSGTEDVVRIYAEATDMSAVESLLESAVAAVHKYVV